MKLYPNLVNQPVGSKVDFVCSYNSKEEMTIEFEEVSNVVMPHSGHVSHTVQRYDWGAESLYQLWIRPHHVGLACTVYNKGGVAVGTLKAMIHHPGLLIVKNISLVCCCQPLLQ
jgi:hypothetical protein